MRPFLPPLLVPLLFMTATAQPVAELHLENLPPGPLTAPWKVRPPESPDRVRVEPDPTAAATARRQVTIRAEPGAWHGFSRQLALPAGKKFTLTVRVSGDACEMHLGAWDGRAFLGWHNRAVPAPSPQTVRYDFYTRPDSEETMVYFNVLSRAGPVEVHFDSLTLVMEP